MHRVLAVIMLGVGMGAMAVGCLLTAPDPVGDCEDACEDACDERGPGTCEPSKTLFCQQKCVSAGSSPKFDDGEVE